MNQSKLGKIGIEDIPVIKREDLFKANFPLANELSDAVSETDFVNPENRANKIATNLHQKGGAVFYSEAALQTYGENQVQTAFKYFDNFRKVAGIDPKLQSGVMAWIADNIFDLERMKIEEESSEE